MNIGMAVDVSSILLIFILLVCLGILMLYFIVRMTTKPKAQLIRYEEEKTFKDPNSPNSRLSFANLEDPHTINLSVVVPAYDEQIRLPKMLDECLEYLENRKKKNESFTYEVIIVDDGSKDSTSKVGLGYSKMYGVEKVRVMTLVKNRGKGGAVKLGMFGSRGEYLLFADADGATKFSDLEKLEASMDTVTSNPEMDAAIVVGSRAHLEKESIAQRSIFRTILMYGFHFLVWFFCVQGIRDTQCGFKLLTREAARLCFSSLHVERWAFDVELLFIAQKLGIQINEIAVCWTEIEGSKVTPFWSSLQMGRDLLLIWFRYKTHAWTITAKSKMD